jgi:hypothetical protein
MIFASALACVIGKTIIINALQMTATEVRWLGVCAITKYYYLISPSIWLVLLNSDTYV